MLYQHLRPIRFSTIKSVSTPTSLLTSHHTFRPLSTSSTYHKNKDPLPPRPTLPDTDLKHVYLKGSGPGGQKINKTSSAVQLTHLPTGIVIKSQATRSRTQNHNIARRILAEKIELIEKGAESRVAKKIERAQRKKASSGKKRRRKYRILAEGGGERGVDEVLGGKKSQWDLVGGRPEEEWEVDEHTEEIKEDDVVEGDLEIKDTLKPGAISRDGIP